MADDTDSWHLKVAQAPPSLGEIELERCRDPREHPALILSLLTLAGMLATMLFLEKYDVLLSLVTIWVSMVITSAQAKIYHRLSGAEVTAEQFPDIHAMVEELSRRFNAPATRVFVIRHQSADAQAFGFRPPYVIALHSALLDSLEMDELRCKVGEQFARIIYGHTRIAILLGGDTNSLPAALSLIAWLRDLIFAWYRRSEVTSRDRASIVACGDVRTALRTQIKLAVGSDQFKSIRESEIMEQARKISLQKNRVPTFLIALQNMTPPLILRLESMVEWGGLPPQKSL